MDNGDEYSKLNGPPKRAHNATQSGVRPEFFEGTPEEHLAPVRRQRRDVAFIWGLGLWPDCESQHLWLARIFAVLPFHHSLARRDQL